MIKHFYLRKWTAVQIKVELDEVHGDSAPSSQTVYLWIKEVKHSRTCTEDKARSGRSIEVITSDIVEKIHGMVMENRRIKLCEIAEAVGTSMERLHNIVHGKLHMKKLCAWWVRRLLNLDQKCTWKDVPCSVWRFNQFFSTIHYLW